MLFIILLHLYIIKSDSPHEHQHHSLYAYSSISVIYVRLFTQARMRLFLGSSMFRVSMWDSLPWPRVSHERATDLLFSYKSSSCPFPSLVCSLSQCAQIILITLVKNYSVCSGNITLPNGTYFCAYSCPDPVLAIVCSLYSTLFVIQAFDRRYEAHADAC